MATTKNADRASTEDQPFRYTNDGHHPEYNLALFIAGALAAHGIIRVKDDGEGFEDFQDATEVIARCLCNLNKNLSSLSPQDMLLDLAMSKP